MELSLICIRLPSIFLADLSKDLSVVMAMMMNPDAAARPSAAQLLQHPFLRSRRRWRCLRLGWRNARLSLRANLIELLFRLFQIFMLIFLPIRALARKWRKPDFGVKPSTPITQRLEPCNFVNDFSFSDGNFLNLSFILWIIFLNFTFGIFTDEVSDLSSAVISGNDSTLGRPLNDSSPLPQNNSIEHRAGMLRDKFSQSDPFYISIRLISMQMSSQWVRRL